MRKTNRTQSVLVPGFAATESSSQAQSSVSADETSPPVPPPDEAGPGPQTAATQSGSSHRIRRLNVRFVIILFAVATVLAGTVYAVHGYQERRIVRHLLDRAEANLPDNPRQALDYLSRYLQLKPRDEQVRLKLGRLLDEQAKTPKQLYRVIQVYEQVLREQPDVEDVRRRQVELMLQFERFSDAKRHLDHLLKDAPADGQLQFLAGLCDELERQEPAEAVKHYQAALADPAFQETTVLGQRQTRVTAYVRMARLVHHEFHEPEQAAALYDRMIEEAPESSEAYLARAVYRQNDGDRAQARADAERARQLAPEAVEPVLLFAELTLIHSEATADDIEQARAGLRQMLERHTDNSRLYQALARLERRDGHPDRTRDVLQAGIAELPEDPDLVVFLADELLNARQIAEAEQQLARLDELQAPELLRDYLRGRLLLERRQLLDAAAMLERVRTQATNQPDLSRRVSTWLAACYGAMGRFEDQLLEWRRVTALDPKSFDGHWGTALTLEALGRDREALEEWQAIERLFPGPQTRDATVRIVRLRLKQTLRLPEPQRRWETVDQALQHAIDVQGETPELIVLRSELLAGKGRPQAALQLLEDGIQQFPRHAAITAARAVLLLRLGETDKARELLAQTEPSTDDPQAFWLARVVEADQQPDAAALTAFGELRSKVATLDETQRPLLLEALAAGLERHGDRAGALRLWRETAELQPENVRVWMQLITSASALSDTAVRDQALRQLEKIEGAGGTEVLCAKAAILLEGLAATAKPDVSQPRSLLDRAAAQRPNSALIELLLAEVERLDGNIDRSLRHYRRAVELGRYDDAMIRRAVEMLWAHQRDEEAKELMAFVAQEVPEAGHPDLLRLGAAVSVKSRELPAALALARKAVVQNPRDWKNLLWLGETALANGQLDEAESALRKAVEVAPGAPAPVLAWVEYLARRGRLSEAHEAVEQASQQLPEAVAAVTLARCAELTGDHERAEAAYRQLRESRPGWEGLQLLTGYYLRTNQLARAEPLLREGLELKTLDAAQQAALRQVLAPVIARQDYPRFQEALRLLDQNLAAAPDDSASWKIKAQVLAFRPSPDNMREVVRILDVLRGRESLAAADLQLLARAYDVIGEKHNAAETWRQLLAKAGQDPGAIRGFLLRQFREHDLTDVQPWLERLEKLEPTAFSTLQFKVQWLVLQQRMDDAWRRLQSRRQALKEDVDADQPAIEELARFLAEIANQLPRDGEWRPRFQDEAEQLYRTLLAKQPAMALPLADLLERRGRLTEALDLLDAARAQVPSLRITGVAVALIHRAHPDAAAVRRVEGWLKESLKGNANPLLALYQLENLYQTTDRYEEALALDRRILGQDPRQVVALNNLAWLLSMLRGDHDQAVSLIQQAIELAGPVPQLLDTQGMVLLNQGDRPQAIQVFQSAVAQDGNPVFRFHLAQAYWTDHNLISARFHWEKAREAGFEENELDRQQRDVYARMKQDLESTDRP